MGKFIFALNVVDFHYPGIIEMKDRQTALLVGKCRIELLVVTEQHTVPGIALHARHDKQGEYPGRNCRKVGYHRHLLRL